MSIMHQVVKNKGQIKFHQVRRTLNHPHKERVIFFTELKADGGSTSYTTKSELERYLDDGEEAYYKGFDILGWWKAASSKYHVLAKMVKDISVIPVSNVASEEAFSTGGRVVDTYRTSLSTPIVEALICTEDWIRASIKKEIYIEDSVEFDDIGKGNFDIHRYTS
ncbi:putative HAT dimerization domain, ribonuclease H-like superfamily [Helianthus annuus]|nr:putative HAT dimerization domain, ribonuclease H-like superfamily [Helianthus annuus]